MKLAVALGGAVAMAAALRAFIRWKAELDERRAKIAATTDAAPPAKATVSTPRPASTAAPKAEPARVPRPADDEVAAAAGKMSAWDGTVGSIPPGVKFFIDGGMLGYVDKRLHGDIILESVVWAKLALATVDDGGAAAETVQKLLSSFDFTGALTVFKFQPKDRPQGTMTAMEALQRGVAQELAKVAMRAAELNRLARTDRLTREANSAEGNDIPAIPVADAAGAGSPVQTAAMPGLWPLFESLAWQERPEDLYAHALVLIGTALAPGFQARVANAAGIAEKVTVKSFGRIRTDVADPDLHRGREAPRAAACVDICSTATWGGATDISKESAPTAEALQGTAVLVAGAFGGVHAVTFPGDDVDSGGQGVGGTPPPADEAGPGSRKLFLRPCTMVLLHGADATLGELGATAAVRAAWDAVRAAVPASFAAETWEAQHDRVVEVLTGAGAGLPAAMYCRCSVWLSGMAELRAQALQLLRVSRRPTGLGLFLEYAPDGVPSDSPDAPPDPPDLFRAAAQGRIAVMSAMLRAGADPNATMEQDGSSPLIFAARGATGERLDAVLALLDAGADVALANKDKATALFEATTAGYTAVVRALLERGADPNVAVAGGATALMSAARNGYDDIIALLLGAGARVGATDDEGKTALYAAAGMARAGAVDALLKAGADAKVGRADGVTPLYVAAGTGSVPIVEALLAAGASVSAVRTADNVGPVFVAASADQPAVLRVLLGAGGEPNMPHKNGATALHQASGVGSLDSVRQLLAAGAVVGARASNGATALHEASGRGHPAVMEALIDASADPNSAARSGVTPLFMAATSGKLESVQVLLAKGADADVKLPQTSSAPGATALFAAAENGHLGIVEALIAAGADAGVTATLASGDKLTAASAARRLGFTEVADALDAASS